MRCEAHHDGHDCQEPGACSRALAAMLARVEERHQRRTDVELVVIWPDDPA